MRERRPSISTLVFLLALSLLTAVLTMVFQNQEPVSTRIDMGR